jgi:hypothetical protein
MRAPPGDLPAFNKEPEMNQRLTQLLAAVLALASLLASSAALAEGATNARERFFMKRQNCEWTDEMGKYIYECVKANNGFNAHWCHNEALDAFCPVEEDKPAARTNASPTSAALAAEQEQEKKRAARQGEDHLQGTIEREKTMLKFKDCPWTDEMGKYVYECVKRQNGFGVHWCHDEALQTMCPDPAKPKS